MEEITRRVTVDDVQLIPNRGPWTTKSDGELMVPLAMAYDVVRSRYLRYSDKELARIPSKFDIRGLRIYTVRHLAEGKIGGGEWHRIREEMVFTLEGSIRWTCEDLVGGKKELVLNGDEGIWIPPFILHSYQVLEPNSGSLVVANTLFDPEDTATQDTYSYESFRELAERHQAETRRIDREIVEHNHRVRSTH